MSQEAEDFFSQHTITEQRAGMGVAGTFVRLSSGRVHLPSKGDVFVKDGASIELVSSLYAR